MNYPPGDGIKRGCLYCGIFGMKWPAICDAYPKLKWNMSPKLPASPPIMGHQRQPLNNCSRT